MQPPPDVILTDSWVEVGAVDLMLVCCLIHGLGKGEQVEINAQHQCRPSISVWSESHQIHINTASMLNLLKDQGS